MFKGLGDKIKGLGQDEIMKYLKGVNFPASKQNILSALTNNNAPKEMTSAVGNLPATNYNSSQDLISALKGKL